MRNDVEIKDVIRILDYRKWSIIGCTLALLALALVWAILSPKQYTATTSILLKKESIGLAGVISGATIDLETTLQDRIAGLQSSTLIRQVMESLSLEADPEFRPEDAAAGELSAVERSNAVENFKKHMQISNSELSNVVNIRFSSRDAVKSANIANEIVATYLAVQQDHDIKRSVRTRRWLDRRSNELQDAIVATEKKLVSSKESQNIPVTDSSLSVLEIRDLSQNLRLLDGERGALQARLDQFNRLSNAGSSAQLGLTEVNKSSHFQLLASRRVEAEKNLAELSTQYGPGHPKMISAVAQRNQIVGLLAAEVSKLRVGLRNELAVVTSRRQEIQQQLTYASDKAVYDFSASIDLDRLVRELAAKRNLLTAVLDNQTGFERQEGLGIAAPAATVITPAMVPYASSSPSRIGLVLLAGIAGLIIGVIWAFFRESLDTRIRNAWTMAAITDLPVVGELPRIKRIGTPSPSPALLVLKKANSRFARIIRKLQWNFALENRRSANKVVVVTSTNPGEGKTTVAASLAISMQKCGQKVLLIDANHYRPGVLKALGLKKNLRMKDAGLSNILRGDISVKSLVMVDKRSGLHIIDAGARLPDPAVLFTDPIFGWALSEYRKNYEWIIIDAPPAGVGPEATLLSQQAGMTILVVDASVTPKVRFMETVQQLMRDGASGLSLVMNKMHIANLNVPTINTSQRLEVAQASSERSRVVSLNFPEEQAAQTGSGNSGVDTKLNVDIEAAEILNLLTRLANKKG